MATPNTTFKRFALKLKQKNYRVEINTQEIQLNMLGNVSCMVFGGPREMFSQAEFDVLKQYI